MSRSQPTMVEFLGGVSIQKIACGGWHSVALAGKTFILLRFWCVKPERMLN